MTPPPPLPDILETPFRMAERDGYAVIIERATNSRKHVSWRRIGFLDADTAPRPQRKNYVTESTLHDDVDLLVQAEESGRTPAKKYCEKCGEPMPAGAPIRLLYDPLYRHPESDDAVYSKDLPPGSLYWKPFGPGSADKLWCMLPRERGWCLDSPSQHGTSWQRTGTPPDITVTPHLQALFEDDGTIRAFIEDGVLRCLIFQSP